MKQQSSMSFKVLGCALLLTISACSSYAINTFGCCPENVKTIVRLSDTKILPFESVSLLIETRNETSQFQEITAQWVILLYTGKVESKEIKWKKYNFYEGGTILEDDPPFSSKRVFNPDSVKIEGVFTIDLNETGQHIFAVPGKYAVSASYGITSDPEYIDVISPTGADANAYDYILKHRLYKFLSENNMTKIHYDRKTEKELAKFAKRFGSSKYAQLAKISIALMNLKGIEGKSDLPKAIEILDKLENDSKEPLRSRAEYYKGIAFYKSGEFEAAKKHFKNVFEKTSDPYLKYISEKAISNQEPRFLELFHKNLF